MALVAVVNVGVLVRDYVYVVHAAREGARAAAVDPDPAAAERAAEASGPLDPGRMDVAVGERGARGSRVTVTVSYRSKVRLPAFMPVLTEIGLQARASMRVER